MEDSLEDGVDIVLPKLTEKTFSDSLDDED